MMSRFFYLFFTYFSFLLCFFFISLSCQQFSSRVQMTEDDLILHFFQFDGNFANLSSACVDCRGRERDKPKVGNFISL